MTLKTSTGRRVKFYLQVGEKANSIDIFGSRSSGGGIETHDWTFYTPHHIFATYHRSSGSGRIDASVDNLNDFGSLHLTFTQTSRWTTSDCDTGATSSTSLAFTGSFYFRTRSPGRHPWGRMGSASHPISFTSKGKAIRFDGCTDRGPLPCSPGTVWQVGPLVEQPLVVNERRVPTIEATRYHPHLGGSSRVQRLDSIVVRVARPRISRDSTGVHLKVTALPDTRVHGSAALSTDQPGDATTRSCLPKPNTETRRVWDNVAYRNDARRLTVLADTGVDISVDNANNATLSLTHVH